MPEVKLMQAPRDALRKSRLSCGNGLIAVRVGRAADSDSVVGGDAESMIEVFEDIPDRVRLAASHGAEGFLFSPGVTAADPFGPEPHVQSATFLAMAAALESGAAVRFLSEGLPAKGFAPLFRRYPDRIAGQIRFVGPAGSAVGVLEPRSASTEARLRGMARLIEIAGMGNNLAARIDPVIPSLNDDALYFEPLARGLEAAGVARAVIAPLRFNAHWRERIADTFGERVLAHVARHYVPGRASRRAAPVPPAERLPLEREASLLWRLKLGFENHGIDLTVCSCKDGRKAACGLGIPKKNAPIDDEQMALWAV